MKKTIDAKETIVIKKTRKSQVEWLSGTSDQTFFDLFVENFSLYHRGTSDQLVILYDKKDIK